jgi:uncharacterized membrane protein
MSGGALTGAGLFARNPFADERMIWAVVALLATLLVGAVLIALADRWRRRQMFSDGTGLDPLAPYREAYEAGEITKGEFDRIRDRMAKRPLPAPPPPAGEGPTTQGFGRLGSSTLPPPPGGPGGEELPPSDPAGPPSA